jgi:hypothetical protein
VAYRRRLTERGLYRLASSPSGVLHDISSAMYCLFRVDQPSDQNGTAYVRTIDGRLRKSEIAVKKNIRRIEVEFKLEMWVYGQSFVGHRRTSYRECPTKIRGLVKIAQTSVRNGADTRLRRFYHSIQGKSKMSSLSYN